MQKNFKSFGIITVVTIFLFMMIACDVGGKSGDKNKFAKIDIVNAKALMVVPRNTLSRMPANNSSSLRAAAGETNRFGKLLEDGRVVQVDTVLGDGSIDNSILPIDIRDVNSTWCIITLHDPSWKYSNYGVRPLLVNKINGATYDLINVGFPYSSNDDIYAITTGTTNLNPKQNLRQDIFTDESGNIYYIAHTFTGVPFEPVIRKINVSNPDRITAEKYTPDIFRIDSFSADSKGNVLFSAYPQTGGDMFSGIKKANGSIELLQENFLEHFTGYDGYIYIIDGVQLKKISFDLEFNTVFDDIAIVPISIAWDSKWVYLDDKILVASYNNIYEVYNSNSAPRGDIKTISNGIRFISQNEKYLYITTNSYSIIKIDSDNGSEEIMLPTGSYYIYKMVVTGDGIIVMNALRLSDSKKILANIYPDKTVSIIDEVGTEITVLTRLN